MKTRMNIAAGCGAALLTLAAFALRPAAQEYQVQGEHVALYNLAGTVSLVPGSGSAVVVNIRPQGGDADRIAVESGEIRGRQTLRLRYPEDRIIYGDSGRSSRTRLRVRADGTFGDGSIRGGETVTIQGSGRGLEAWADLTVEVPAGQRLSLYLGAGAATVENVDGNLEIDTGAGSVQSDGTSGTLSIDTGSGSVVVTNAEGTVHVDTGSGGVTVEEVSGERLEVDTGSGSVRATGVSAGSVSVDTGSGAVTLLAVAAPDIMVDTGSGRVEVDLVADVDDLEVDTGSGGVTLRVPADLGAVIEADTGSGSIEVDVPFDAERRRRTHLRGTLGDGRGSILVDTGAGSIRILGR